MAVVATRPAVDTTAGGTVIAAGLSTVEGEQSDIRAVRFLLKNLTGTASIFLGPSGVTTANGFEWKITDPPLEIELEPGESLYGIVAAAAQTVHALRQGR